MRAALYGTVADVDKLLAEDLDVNATATPGGVTALMCAVHDSEKVRRLLAAGADVGIATDTGHTALLLAARYAGAGQASSCFSPAGSPSIGPSSKAILWVSRR
jgi:ankyrin repeat protein